jgi:hypothetical protein
MDESRGQRSDRRVPSAPSGNPEPVMRWRGLVIIQPKPVGARVADALEQHPPKWLAALKAITDTMGQDYGHSSARLLPGLFLNIAADAARNPQSTLLEGRPANTVAAEFVKRAGREIGRICDAAPSRNSAAQGQAKRLEAASAGIQFRDDVELPPVTPAPVYEGHARDWDEVARAWTDVFLQTYDSDATLAMSAATQLTGMLKEFDRAIAPELQKAPGSFADDKGALS